MTTQQIKAIVRDLSDRFGTASAEKLCEEMNVTVVKQDLPERINGFTVRMEGLPFIVLRNGLEDSLRKFVLSHELGHIVLHDCTNTLNLSANTRFCVNKFEREADLFAACLLIEEEMDALAEYDTVTAEDAARMSHIPPGKMPEDLS